MTDLDKIRFKSYCWVVGNTSFRMKNFNYNIELQLMHLKEFFSNKRNADKPWSECQRDYYYFLQSKGFVKGDAGNPEKDAREKTSGLKDLGLVNKERRLTKVGERLVNIAKAGDFKDNNFFGIDKDSYIYLNQLLKYTTKDRVRPFVVLIKVLSELDYITEEEFKYFLPLVTSEEKANEIVIDIKQYRSGTTNLDDLLVTMIKSMDNYKNALDYFLENNPSEDTFKIVNMNRKSPQYERKYHELFKDFVDVYVEKKEEAITRLFDDVQRLGSVKKYWKVLLFGEENSAKIKKNPRVYLKPLPIDNSGSIDEVKKLFFYYTHLFKWKNTLNDYYDLNKRYFKIADIIRFEESKVYLSTAAKYYFKHCIDEFFLHSFSDSQLFDSVTTVDEVLGSCAPEMEAVLKDIASDLGEEYIDPNELKNYISNERLREFNELIDKKFTNQHLLKYLEYFEKRNDEALMAEITDDADAPTIFEYILAICWYKLSGRKGDILDYMNVSLDANMLPKQHAGGGKADIVYKYNDSSDYPGHTLLLEATLVDSQNQRRMEMEPVSRHLMKQREASENDNDYAILVTTFVHPSVVADFRGRANTDQTLDNKHFFDGLKIFALGTDSLKELLRKGKKYSELYDILEQAHLSDLSIRDGWYKKEVLQRIEETS